MSNELNVLTLRTLLGDYPNTLSLKRGEIRPSGFVFDFADVKRGHQVKIASNEIFGAKYALTLKVQFSALTYFSFCNEEKTQTHSRCPISLRSSTFLCRLASMHTSRSTVCHVFSCVHEYSGLWT